MFVIFLILSTVLKDEIEQPVTFVCWLQYILDLYLVSITMENSILLKGSKQNESKQIRTFNFLEVIQSPDNFNLYSLF